MRRARSLTLPAARTQSLAGLRVAVLPPIDLAPLDDSVGAAIEAVAEAASRSGAIVQIAAPDVDWTTMIETYRALLAIAVFAELAPHERRRLADELDAAGDDFERGTIRGLRASATAVSELHVEREVVRRAWASFFLDWDVVVAPITLGPAFEHAGTVA